MILILCVGMTMKKSLLDIPRGMKVCVSDISGVSAVLRRRLIDLGIMEGAEISIKRKLPFGGPLALEVNGQWIGIRRWEAGKIEVEG